MAIRTHFIDLKYIIGKTAPGNPFFGILISPVAFESEAPGIA